MSAGPHPLVGGGCVVDTWPAVNRSGRHTSLRIPKSLGGPLSSAGRVPWEQEVDMIHVDTKPLARFEGFSHRATVSFPTRAADWFSAQSITSRRVLSAAHSSKARANGREAGRSGAERNGTAGCLATCRSKTAIRATWPAVASADSSAFIDI